MVKKMNKKNDNLGFTSIELAMGMLLLIIFGAIVFILAGSGSTAYEKIVDQKNVNSEYRVATSYLQTKIRQNDAEEGIMVVSDPELGSVVVKVKEQNGEFPIETWIYVSDGYLKEVSLFEGVDFDDDFGFEIAEIDAFQLIEISEKSTGFRLTKNGQEPVEVWVGSQAGFIWEELE